MTSRGDRPFIGVWPNAVTAAKVLNGSLLAADFRRGQLPRGATGPAGPIGQQGPAGPKGDKGETGAAATALWAKVVGSAVQRGQGVDGVMLTGAGTYRVTFNRDVSQCALVATPTRTDTPISASVSTTSNRDASVYAVSSSNQLSDFSIAAFC